MEISAPRRRNKDGAANINRRKLFLRWTNKKEKVRPKIIV